MVGIFFLLIFVNENSRYMIVATMFTHQNKLEYTQSSIQFAPNIIHIFDPFHQTRFKKAQTNKWSQKSYLTYLMQTMGEHLNSLLFTIIFNCLNILIQYNIIPFLLRPNCAIFVLKYIECFIVGYSIESVSSNTMTIYRWKIAVDIFYNEYLHHRLS